jgi:hypothetical protein
MQQYLYVTEFICNRIYINRIYTNRIYTVAKFVLFDIMKPDILFYILNKGNGIISKVLLLQKRSTLVLFISVHVHCLGLQVHILCQLADSLDDGENPKVFVFYQLSPPRLLVRPRPAALLTKSPLVLASWLTRDSMNLHRLGLLPSSIFMVLF